MLFALVVGGAVGVGGIALGTVLLARASGHAHAKTPAVVATSVPAQRPPHPTRAEQARASAERIAAALPVALDSTALLRVGGTLYAVGGTARDGKPTAAIWRIDLAGGHARRVASFIEPLADAGVARRGGVLYLAGGWTGQKLATAVLRWSPGEAAVLVARLPVAMRGASAGFAGGSLYVAKGSNIFAVDVATGTVAQASALPRKLRGKDSNLDYLIQSQASYH